MSDAPRPTGLSRRTFLLGTSAAAAAGGAAGWLGHQYAGPLWNVPPDRPEDARINAAWQPRGLPGVRPGRVVEIHDAGAVGTVQDQGYTRRNREAVRQMLARGMQTLVGSDDATQAWRWFFAPRDRVGIKVVPVGKPDSISSYEVVLEIIAGLESAGVQKRDILVFERYRNEFLQCRYPEFLPDGVYWECASAAYDNFQLELDGQLPGQTSVRNVAGYDRDVYRELPFCQPQTDPADDRRFRSHLTKIVTQRIDKFISVPVLKDHRSSGVTLALKNLSHGLVNNVARSHIGYSDRAEGRGRSLNQCNTFIPANVALPPTRQKAVLQILDGLVGTWEGGPGTWNRSFATWNYGSLFFATDPVALDHVGWRIIDAKRAEENWPAVSEMGLSGRTGIVEFQGQPVHEQFPMRQPEHIPLAGTLGLGTFDIENIQHQRIDLT